MHIGLITPGFSAAEDDWCIPAVLDLVRTLTLGGDRVTVLALRYPHHRRPYEVAGADVVPLGAAEARGAGRLSMLWRAAGQLDRLHSQTPFDVLHGLWAHEPGVVVVRAGRRHGVPSLVSVMGGELADLADIDYGGARGRINRRLVSHALGRGDRIGVGSRQLAGAVEHAMGRAPLVLPLGVDPQRFRPGPPDDRSPLAGAPAILNVGSLVPVKGQVPLVRAFSRVAGAFPDAVLHVVGEGPLHDAIERAAEAHGVGGRVRLHGAVDHGAMAPFYRGADLLVQSSRFESQGMAVLEGIAAGCPAIGTDVGVLPELAGPDLPRHTVAADQPEALAGLLSAFLSSEPARHSLGQAQGSIVDRRFTLEKTVEGLRQAYRALAG